jgi:hypothetical protein
MCFIQPLRTTILSHRESELGTARETVNFYERASRYCPKFTKAAAAVEAEEATEQTSTLK